MSNNGRLEISRAPIIGNPCMDVEHPYHRALGRAGLRGVYVDGLNIDQARYRITNIVEGAARHIHLRLRRQY